VLLAAAKANLVPVNQARTRADFPDNQTATRRHMPLETIASICKGTKMNPEENADLQAGSASRQGAISTT